MDASQYITLGAILAAAVLLVALLLVLVRAVRRRAHRARDAGINTESSREWLPPSTPAPLDQLASVSLESRIAAWVSVTPQSGTELAAQAAVRGEIAAPPPVGPAPLQPIGLGTAVSEPEGAREAPVLGEAEPPHSAYASAPGAPVLLRGSPGGGPGAVAPVELWVDGTRVLVDADDESSAEFRRYANELLGDLARTRKQ